jgi:hypothetical protein
MASMLIARGDFSCEGHPHLINPRTLHATPNWQTIIEQESWRQEWVGGNRHKEPSDYYLEAWLLVRLSEDLDYRERVRPIRAALDVLKELQKRVPAWKPDLVSWKIGQVTESVKDIEKRQIDQQGGAGQPATRSESDSEGGDKPQPESEGRSR